MITLFGDKFRNYHGNNHSSGQNTRENDRQMRKLLLSLVLIPSLAYSSQEITVEFQSYCMTEPQLKNLLQKYNEKPMFKMASTRILSENMVKNSPTTLYANPKEGSWTLVEKSTEDLHCVIAAGMGITPIRSKNDKEVSR